MQPVVLLPGPPAPAFEYRTESQGIKGLVIAGSITFGAAYVLNVLVTAALDSDSDIKVYSPIPLVGPWIMYKDDRAAEYRGQLLLDGVLQGAGLTMFILGVAIRREVQVPYYVGAGGGVRVGMSAVPTPRGSVLVLDGQF